MQDNPILGKFNAPDVVAGSEPNNPPKWWNASHAQLINHIARLEGDLLECREYLETEVDVVDGDYGEPAPNRAMQLVTMIDEALHGPGNF